MPIYSDDPNLPNYARPEYVASLRDLELLAHELGGTRSMWANAKRYIRKWTAEAEGNYKIRALCETFFEGIGRTLSAAIGMLFAKPPAIEWNAGEATIGKDWTNIDAAGTAGEVFVKRYAEMALRDGLAALLVDHPSAPQGVVVTEANEQALNLRPTWAAYGRAAIINWYSDTVNNEATLTLLVFHEPRKVRLGLFGVSTVHRFRVLRLESMFEGRKRLGNPMTQGELDATEVMPVWATWELYEQKNEGTRPEDFDRVGAGLFQNRAGEPAQRLPVSISYTGRTDGIMDARIPLLGVAFANLSHWQLSTNLRFNTEVAAFAQPTVSGRFVPDEQTGTSKGLEIGPLVFVHLEQGGEFKWTEAAGTGLERLAKLVLTKLDEMSAQGVSFLSGDKRAAETAEAKRLDSTAENSTLATAGQGIEDSVNMAFETHAWYRGIDKDTAPVLTISRDYESTALESPIMVAYIQAVKDAGLPIRILLEAWQQGGRIRSDENLEELEMEMAANAQAAADAAAEAAANAQQGPKLVKDQPAAV
jgi:hypothetical protein